MDDSPRGRIAIERATGMTAAGLRHLQSLMAERSRSTWEVGDAMCRVYGKPPPPGVLDGSRARMTVLADVLGCSLSWLISCRLTSAAWPTNRRSFVAGWAVHRDLKSRPDRVRLLADFVADCERARVGPSVGRLRDWLDERTPSDPGHRDQIRSVGRPRLDPVDVLARRALKLDPASIIRLIDKLTAIVGIVGASEGRDGPLAPVLQLRA